MNNTPHRYSGFSLVELLVVVVLMGLISVMISEVFIMTIRSHVKSEIIKEIKQSGDYALSVIESMVRNSTNFSIPACNTNTQAFTITNPDGYSTTFDCSDGVSIASVGATRQSLTSEKTAVSVCTFRVVCPQPGVGSKYVLIYFTLRQKDGNVALEQQASQEFQTTVVLRSSL